MAFNLNQFKSNLTGENSNEVAKQSHFEMWLSLPRKILLSDDSKSAITPLRFRIDTAEFPGRSIVTSDYKSTGYGLSNKVGYGAVYPDVNISMVCDSKLNEKKLFTSWQNIIVGNHNRQQNIRKHQSIGYYNDYISDVLIVQYNQEGVPTYAITLREAYPIIINSLPLNWGSEEFHKLNVQFSYKYYTDMNEPGLGRGAQGGGQRGGRSITGITDIFDDFLGQAGLPDFQTLTGRSVFNTNGFTIR
jgi:hypothetical protein